jgi:hypothetical protein
LTIYYKISFLIWNRLLAAKTHYFGVGGGTVEFKKVVEKEDIFDFEVVEVLREGKRHT